MIKFHVVEEAKKAKEAVLYILCTRLLGELLIAKCIDLSLLIDYSTHIKDVIQCYYYQFSPVST